MFGVCIKKDNWKQIHKEGLPCEDEDKYWVDALTSQGRQLIASSKLPGTQNPTLLKLHIRLLALVLCDNTFLLCSWYIVMITLAN
jgi:hypothetical protein